MAAREGALSEVASGRVRDVRLRLVDPATCRMWSKHNRLYDLLTKESCAELIGSIRAQGKQEVPAVVRRLRDDPEGYEYEVVAGARRHFAVSYLRQEENRKEVYFLIEVRDLEDEEAFRFSDLENRNRKDISDYERGREYLAALHDYYGNNATRMAERMEVSKSLLSSYLSVATLPQEVIDAYADPRDIAVRHGQQLRPLLNGEGATALLDRAREVAAMQRTLREKGQAGGLEPAEVFRRLKGSGPRAKATAHTVTNPTGRPVLTAKRAGGRLKLDIDVSMPRQQILDAVRAALDSRQD
ncbi:ParB/RepB/Spo0J family partition protein [Parvularcula dongshanensis]|uniref:ParB family chromosome partitioning protein n=1 Tax=Parvularcula dongshanensis TaxID=1173995 RepID=A0A840I5D3_9PROT|nr:ParB/RepB/Spo0J family partition protein [Parvularcula dongshanensis]MBB4659491.1 ParB family chromosome partitioning protein [Parvularcula dongshanensis]